ncbi:glycosyltransferase [Actinokineospora sp. NBRC 105648]|uniref:glycosyltransferase n=1 Tax=Actinokineospora sp. NBRC 105648 TaxID=3032206 RepID=UPI0024A4508F|nr:glycosyltransferase [Actinokineospora sp. NBRC 105648]GLZ40640.1 galactofuranosyl transferase GlfT2 [Actinokineospora sp. NBRC 105648]
MTEQDSTRRSGAQVVLQRVILPRDTDPVDVRPLYLDEPETAHCHVSSRTAVTVPASARVSFAAYFNAFPASYWKRWTRLTEVILRLDLRGGGRVDVYRSKPNGDQVHVAGQAVRTGADAETVEFRVDLAPFEDGGWIWFDVFTDERPLVISDAFWATDLDLPAKRLSIGTTTFNRPDDCVAALLALGEDQAVLDVLAKVYVADQGTKKIVAHPRFAEAAALLGARLEVIDQGNLGGSGGFSRALYESVEHSDVDQIVLMDDDIALEPDSILRASAFARAATSPLVVGSQMLNLQARSRLHSMGEVVDLGSCTWGPAPGAVTDHDFGTDSLRKTRALHRRIDAGYNGWWMCLFPREVVEANGLPLPLFIKWDDAEYSLRALEKGYPTVTLPGSGVWHMPWTDKNDLSDWTVYFHLRNRLVIAALYSPHDQRKTLLKQGLRSTIRRLLSMEYSTVAIELKAIEDFLAGPDRFFELLPTALPQVQQLRKRYTDAQLLASASEVPPPTLDAAHAERMLRPPTHPARIAAQASKAVLRNLRPPAPTAQERPQVNVPAGSALWFLLGNLDSATVSTPDGSGVAFRRRDPEVFRDLSKRAAATYRRLVAEWPQAQATWKAALPELTSTESWRKVFEN